MKKQKIPTISNICYCSPKAEIYFSPKTMKFFKQKRSDFKVYRTNDENIFLVKAEKNGLVSQRLYNSLTHDFYLVDRG